MYGKGLIKGLGIVIKHFFEKKITEKYPEVMPNLPPRSHGSFQLDLNKCISCGICANQCPNKVIEITSEKDENNKKQLTGYKMNIGRCLFCGLCVENCPTKALKTTTIFELSCFDRKDCLMDLVAVGYRDGEPPQPKVAAPKAEEKAADVPAEPAQPTEN